MMRLVLALLLLALPAAADDDIATRLDRLMPGDYAPADPDADFVLYSYIRAVDLPAFGDRAWYMEMRRNAPDGPVSRQRIYVLTDAAGPAGGRVMVAYDFPEKAPYFGAWAAPQRLAGLRPEAMLSFPDGCVIEWFPQGEGAIGRVPPSRCRIVNKESGIPRDIAMDFGVSPAGMTLMEQGFNLDGSVAFGVAEPLSWDRLAE